MLFIYKLHISQSQHLEKQCQKNGFPWLQFDNFVGFMSLNVPLFYLGFFGAGYWAGLALRMDKSKLRFLAWWQKLLKNVEVEATGPLEAEPSKLSHYFCHIPRSKQVTRPVQTSEIGTYTPTLEERSYKILCPYFSISHSFLLHLL